MERNDHIDFGEPGLDEASELLRRSGVAAENDYPQEGVKNYRQKADEAVEERNRFSNQRAADWLNRVRRIWPRPGEQSARSNPFNPLGETRKRLPVFQGELRKADL